MSSRAKAGAGLSLNIYLSTVGTFADRTLEAIPYELL
jgi:hypothetical protein